MRGERFFRRISSPSAMVGSHSRFPSSPTGYAKSEQYKDDLKGDNYDLIARQVYQFLSSNRHAALRVKVFAGVILSVLTGLLVHGGWYFWLWRRQRWLGLFFLGSGAATVFGTFWWALGFLGEDSTRQRQYQASTNCKFAQPIATRH